MIAEGLQGITEMNVQTPIGGNAGATRVTSESVTTSDTVVVQRRRRRRITIIAVLSALLILAALVAWAFFG